MCSLQNCYKISKCTSAGSEHFSTHGKTAFLFICQPRQLSLTPVPRLTCTPFKYVAPFPAASILNSTSYMVHLQATEFLYYTILMCKDNTQNKIQRLWRKYHSILLPGTTLNKAWWMTAVLITQYLTGSDMNRKFH